MSTEIELKLQLTAKSAKKLASHPLLLPLAAQKQHLLNTYYDTPELALHAKRIAMRFRKKGEQWLLTVKSAEPASGGLAVRSEWEKPALPGVFDFSHVDEPSLRDFLETARPQMAAVFTTDFRRQIWHVPFGHSLIELALDRGTIESQGRKSRICEIELELLSGDIDDIFKLTRKLQDKLELSPAIASKAERGYKLFNDEPLKPFKAKPAGISVDMQPVEAFRCIALGCLEHFQRNEEGLHLSNDPEFIHQARVALRRLRSAIKLFSPVLPPEFVSTYGQTWRTLASALGEARNWDVFLEETLPPIQAVFPEHGDIRRLRTEARRSAKSARQSVVKLLAVREYQRLIVEFTAAIYALRDTLPMPIKSYAKTSISRQYKQTQKKIKNKAFLSENELHSFRIECKSLRYAFDFFAPILPSQSLRKSIESLETAQEYLGKINDCTTALKMLERKKTRSMELLSGWIRCSQTNLIKIFNNSVKKHDFKKYMPWGLSATP
ncbi:CHAD domain-containing protein [Dechloromonas sp. TW-R-39-2]|uniref:CYTH and CHAD domain-containing protein n=1 Tax=Dechloromonas sp. TW-R-39-2 TaxID=2654218 RepID=UPI00193E202E|nr:CYTH and CHAD domain-containing protein [Dechloromonas sp. TW-R-39-2]QRM20552.1 CHAD domain-containing protein [Dechloromonas sp. TW-R-39-2]